MVHTGSGNLMSKSALVSHGFNTTVRIQGSFEVDMIPVSVLGVAIPEPKDGERRFNMSLEIITDEILRNECQGLDKWRIEWTYMFISVVPMPRTKGCKSCMNNCIRKNRRNKFTPPNYC
jgi:hypothetical protein